MDAETIHTLDTTNTSELTMNTDATIPRSTCCWPTLQSPAQPVARSFWLQGFVGGRLGALWVARCIVGAWVGVVNRCGARTAATRVSVSGNLGVLFDLYPPHGSYQLRWSSDGAHTKNFYQLCTISLFVYEFPFYTRTHSLSKVEEAK